MTTRPALSILTTAATVGALLVSGVATATTAGAAGDLYVSPTGKNTNPGTEDAPLQTVQAAVDKATPGTTIRLMAGTYTGAVKIKTSGTLSAPIRITNAGDGEATLTYASKPQPCSNGRPAADRTITIGQGVDNWQIDGLTIHNGIWIAGKKSNIAYNWLTKYVNERNWEARREAPGHGSYDPEAAQNDLIAFLRAKTGDPQIDSSDGIKILDNTMTGRGVYGALTSYGEISGNKISEIPCGIGPGIWLMTFSNGWKITDNDVTDIAISTAAHYMQEGIRLGSAADYNEVSGNNVHDLPGDGRGINTDVDSSWNYIHNNTVSNVAIGYNEQMAGWGNRWEYNTVSNYRTYGFGFRLMDAPFTAPSLASSSNEVIVRCNVTSGAVGTAKALGAGAMQNATFEGNDFPLIWLSKNLAGYWSSVGNIWDGSSVVPSKNPPLQQMSC